MSKTVQLEYRAITEEYARRPYPVEILHEKGDGYDGWFAQERISRGA